MISAPLCVSFPTGKRPFDVALHEKKSERATPRVLLDSRHNLTPSLSCLKESRDHSRCSTAHQKTRITSAFSEVPRTSVLFTSAVEREELSIHWLVVTLHTQNHASEASIPLSSSSDQHPQIPASSISPVSSTAATVAFDGGPSTAWTFLSFPSARRFRQTSHL